MKMDAAKNVHVWGKEGDRHVTVDVDDDKWFEFNKEYYKLREMEYDAMYNI